MNWQAPEEPNSCPETATCEYKACLTHQNVSLGLGALRRPVFIPDAGFSGGECRTSGPLDLRRRRSPLFTTRFSIPAAGANQMPPSASSPGHNDVSSDMRRI